MACDPLKTLPPQLTADDVVALGRENPHWFGDAAAPRSLDTAPVGRGESFTVWSLTGDEGPSKREVIVRVPHRPVAELPQPLEAEFSALSRAPRGVTAQAIAVHTPTTEDPRAYAVTTRVPGSVVQVLDWTDAMFAALAHQLARLHVHAAGSHGIGRATFDPVADADAARHWWRTNEPGAARTIEPLFPALRRHQEVAQRGSPSGERCFIHGDVSLANVLVGSDGVPRLVDWEWSHDGDPARDLAYSGGAVHVDPYYAPMSESQVLAQAEAYAAERERLGAPVDLDGLLIRRAAWLLHEVLFTSAHFWRVAQRGGAQAESYAAKSQHMRKVIREYLG